MTDRQLMQQALEALQKIYIAPEHEEYIRVWWPACEQAITALRQAIANEALDKMAENARELGLDYEPAHGTQISKVWWDLHKDKLMAERIDPATIYQKPQMQPCAGRNCGSTNSNLHSAECFEDYDKATGMSMVKHAVIAGALFDFMGWLTSRKERIVLSSADEASPAVDAIRDFAKMRGLSLDDAKVQDWQDMARGSNAP